MVVIRNFVDVGSSHRASATVSWRPGWASRVKAVIGYAGGLFDCEGLDLLLDAVAGLKARRSDFHVVIVGDGHYERVLRAYAGRLRLDDVVTFARRISHDEIGLYLSLFDVAPFPRLPRPVCELISPIKPFESMAMQKPVVVSSVAALTDIVRTASPAWSSARVTAPIWPARSSGYSTRQSCARRSTAPPTTVAQRDWSTIVEAVETTCRAVLEHTALPSGV